MDMQVPGRDEGRVVKGRALQKKEAGLVLNHKAGKSVWLECSQR